MSFVIDTNKLNEWKRRQISAIGSMPFQCPNCDVTVKIADVCSNCNAPILRRSFAAQRIVGLVAGLFLLTVAAWGFWYIFSDVLPKLLPQNSSPTVRIVISLIIIGILGSMLRGAKVFFGNLFGSGTMREKYFKAAEALSRTDAEKFTPSVSRLFSEGLATDFLLKTAGDIHAAFDFWKELPQKGQVPDTLSLTLRNLLFLDLWLVVSLFDPNDIWGPGLGGKSLESFKSALATVTYDSPALLELAKIIHSMNPEKDKVHPSLKNLADITNKNAPRFSETITKG